MQLTSAQAGKLLRKLNEEYNMILQEEEQSREFVVSIQEDPEDARPAYDMLETLARLKALEKKIRTVRHAINVFNTTHTVPGFDMTVDQVLVYLPQLTALKYRLSAMSKKLPKKRVDPTYRSGNLVEYTYVNYDIDQARAMLSDVNDELGRLQLALDEVNARETMEIDL